MVITDKYLTSHFRVSEMRCRCRRPECDAVPMDVGHMALLEQLRELWGAPLVVTSGARCAYWNQLVGGARGSQHLLGKATDFRMDGPTEVQRLAALAEKAGFGGIGTGDCHLIHVDTGPPGRRWEYQGR